MLRVRTVFSGAPGSPWLNTMYFVGNTQALADAAVVDVGAYWGAVDAFIVNTVSWATEGDVADIDHSTGELVQTFGTTPASGSGGSAVEVLPTATQGLHRWTTAGVVVGRRVRGRTFIPGLSETANVNGVWTSSQRTTVNAAGAALIASAASEFAIWSRPHPGDPDAEPPIAARAGTAHIVTSGSTWDRFAVQRSRRD
jgi:hypothetical protein